MSALGFPLVGGETEARGAWNSGTLGREVWFDQLSHVLMRSHLFSWGLFPQVRKMWTVTRSAEIMVVEAQKG